MYSSVPKSLAWLLVGLLLFTASLVFAANKESKASPVKQSLKTLPARYRDWLSKEVPYIISNQEKEVFLQLASDQERDDFIEHFWAIRNPTPGSPDNAYKSEYYRRISYANQYFGHATHTEGWRTDMGRVYITLGEPAQRQKLLGLQKITPMEIWFYSNSDPALPPYFYIIFFQRDSASEFKLYSPYSDGPESLINAVAGPDRMQALNIIAQDAGKDVARETLSLIPDEPVDFQGGTISLQSDVMLATIRNFANNPIHQAELAHRRQLIEDVSHRVILGGEYLDVLTVPLRDPEGNPNLHYLLRVKKPEDLSLGKSSSGQYYYSVLESASVRTSEGKLILTDQRKINRDVTPAQFDQIKSKVFGYEGWLPLPPGKYKIEFQLTDLLHNTVFRREVEATIPDSRPGVLQVSNLVPFAEAGMVAPALAPVLPFTGAGVRFIPIAGQELELKPGQDLKFFYQAWLAPASPASRPQPGKNIDVDYVYGRLGAHDTRELRDAIPMDQLDPGGSILNGKLIPTGDLPAGSYRLVATLRDPDTQAKAYASLVFSISPESSATPAWDVSDPALADNVKKGITDSQRASCYMILGDPQHALEWLQRAYAKNPHDELVRSKLVDLYFGRQQYSKVADLYADDGLTGSTDEQTILRMASSLDKLGQIQKSIQMLEGVLPSRPTRELYLTLAGYYQRTGNPAKAAEMERKAKLLAAAPQS